MFLTPQCFGEGVGGHLSHQNVLKPNDLILDRSMNEDQYISCRRILCQGNCALAVREQVGM